MLTNSYISHVKVINSRALLCFCCQIEFSLDQLKGSLRTPLLWSPRQRSREDVLTTCKAISADSSIAHVDIRPVNTHSRPPSARSFWKAPRIDLQRCPKGSWALGTRMVNTFFQRKKMAVQGGTLVLLLAGYFFWRRDFPSRNESKPE